MPMDPITVVPRQIRKADARADWPTDNKFLNGPFAPWTEESEGYDLEVDGEIPADLAGALFRVSSNPRFQPRNTDRYHWWEGDGMVCGVYLRAAAIGVPRVLDENQQTAVVTAALRRGYGTTHPRDEESTR